MYLKVKTKPNAECDWWIFECYKIHYRREPKVIKGKPSVLLGVHAEDFNVFINSETSVHFIVAHLGTVHAQDYVVVFDTVAYLCSDKGETIEKLVP